MVQRRGAAWVGRRLGEGRLHGRAALLPTWLPASFRRLLCVWGRGPAGSVGGGETPAWLLSLTYAILLPGQTPLHPRGPGQVLRSKLPSAKWLPNPALPVCPQEPPPLLFAHSRPMSSCTSCHLLGPENSGYPLQTDSSTLQPQIHFVFRVEAEFRGIGEAEEKAEW